MFSDTNHQQDFPGMENRRLVEASKNKLSPKTRLALAAAGVFLIGSMLAGYMGVQAVQQNVREGITLPFSGDSIYDLGINDGNDQNPEGLDILGPFGQGN
ncbi:hypothetical protein KC675_04340 [Candidatus Dojkabacteria bacterium]|uniref:Uncharacterized protein n=1 Tax=Candidatus Dojkabacteria bacterium TaxID=2099670 RepID=A0A955I7D3_9BACT|nr:hypothetical protein [Candidatus Dojkabacteria bacterium]